MFRIWFLKAPKIVKKNTTIQISFWRFRITLPFITKNTFDEILIDNELIERRSRTETFWFPIGFKKKQFDLEAENNKKMYIKIRVGYYD
jgi:hypothetical protein